MAISSETGLDDDEDGIIGLWSGNLTGVDNSDMLMSRLCAQSKLLTDCVFSFYMTGTTESSFIDFGTINPSIVTDLSKVAKLDVLGDDGEGFWSQKVTGFRWGNYWDDDTEYAVNSTYGMTDTGCSCIVGPPRYIDYITKKILDTTNNPV